MAANNHVDAAVMLPVGRTLQMGKYKVEAHLSSGGFGNTYVVTNTQFDERWAMKEFFMKGVNQRDGNDTTVSVSNAANRPQFDAQRDKFKKEARRLRKLHHPNIVGVDDLFDENGTTYYIMDYIGGGSLSDQVKSKGVFTEAGVMRLLPQLLSALEYIHDQQMWHLDLKPGNILLNEKGQPVLIDFGASKQLGLSNGNSTSTGMTYTPGYAPSEQVDQNIERIGPWTDLYALGGTLYNLLTNQAPPSVSEIQEGAAEAFEFPKTVSRQMRNLIVWLMSPNRLKRPQSVADVRAYLKDPDSHTSTTGTTSEDTISVNTSSSSTRKKAPSQQSWWQRLSTSQWVGVCSAFVVALVVVLLVGLSGRGGEEEDVINEPEPPITSVTNKTYASVLGTYEYTGPVDTDLQPDGKGKAVFIDGACKDCSYDGPFDHGKLQGTDATFRYPNGDVFEGEFRNGAFYRGRYTVKANGDYFEGTYKNGQPDKGSWYNNQNKKLSD